MAKTNPTTDPTTKPQYKTAICWLRRDLRLFDHAVLSAATHQAEQVQPVFVFDTNILGKLKDNDDRRVRFLVESVQELQKNFAAHGSHLLVKYGDPAKIIPALAKQLGAKIVFFGKDYQGYAKIRDASVCSALSKMDIDSCAIKEHVIFESQELMTGSKTPFKVFTPYKNLWLKTVRQSDIVERKLNYGALHPKKDLKLVDDPHTLKDLGFIENDLLIKPGEAAARKQLGNFRKTISEYKNERDFPALDSTSRLSIHLRFGTLSIRECVRMASDIRTEGSRCWLSELIWRDFYHMILDQFPHVESGCFKPECDQLEWPGEPKHFEAWKQGQTGFPLVDAAMRHFAKTGWMHNRLRMVVASFLTKDLLIHWKQGERYFAQKLLDYDCAANNGGWQWSASTGCDAQPYFRIFNPFSQSERFDPDGDFIRQHVPELKNFNAKYIHRPFEAPQLLQEKWGCKVGRDYPQPIVDHSKSRDIALDMFKRLKA